MKKFKVCLIVETPDHEVWTPEYVAEDLAVDGTVVLSVEELQEEVN
jgi:hypothetical protein